MIAFHRLACGVGGILLIEGSRNRKQGLHIEEGHACEPDSFVCAGVLKRHTNYAVILICLLSGQFKARHVMIWFQFAKKLKFLSCWALWAGDTCIWVSEIYCIHCALWFWLFEGELSTWLWNGQKNVSANGLCMTGGYRFMHSALKLVQGRP